MCNHCVAHGIAHLSTARKGMLAFELLRAWRSETIDIDAMRSMKRSTDWYISPGHLFFS